MQRNFTLPVPDPPKSDWTGVDLTQTSLEAKALGFNCLNYAAAAEGSLYRHFLPDKDYLDANCADGIRMELMFPSCWNGVDVTSPDHKSHVAYPDQVMTGTCPDGFPERLISLFYETIWNTAAYIGVDGQFVISNGDPTGYGYHGDFIMGWDQDFLQEAADTCTNASGEISDCSIFTIQDSDVYNSCKFDVPDELADEDVFGPVDAIPGDVAIESGPARVGVSVGVSVSVGATSTSAGSASNTAASKSSSTHLVPSLSYSAGTTIAASASQTYALGGVFEAVSISTSAATITSAPTAAASASSEDFVSTSIWTSGQDAYEVFWVEETVTVTADAAAETPAAKRRSTHKHGHARRAAH